MHSARAFGRPRPSFARPALALFVLALGCAENAGKPPRQRETVETSRAFATSGSRAWFQTQKLVAEGPAGNAFGAVVAISENAVLVGPPDRGPLAYTLANGEWGGPQELGIDDPVTGFEYGVSASISGDTAVVGAPDGIGYARVFSKTDSDWIPGARLSGNPASIWGHFGAAVAVDGDVIVVGAPLDRTAYVFSRSGDDWSLRKQLFATNPPPLPYRFGAAVAISGRTIVVGAPGDVSYPSAGAAYVFTMPSEPSEAWPTTQLVPSVRESSDGFGHAVAVSDDTILIGGDRRSAYVFTRQGASWSEQKLTSEASCCDQFGTSVAISGARAVVGAPYLQAGPRFVPGGAFVYVQVPSGWREEQAIIHSVSGEFFGAAVAVAGDWLIAGAPEARSGGAAYVYELLGATGSACAASSDCGLGACVSGVCCESACDKACEECSTGVCLPVARGNPGSPACAPYVCDGARRVCPARCLTTDDCVETFYCLDDECTPQARLTEPCSGPEQCLSGHCLAGRCAGRAVDGSACERASDCERGHCVDGVCCNDACRGQCEACDVVGNAGRCTPVIGAPHGEREPCAADESVCGGECNGEITAGCVYATSTLVCASACEHGSETISTCNGQGHCEVGEARSCGRLACDDENVACRSTCESNRDCAEGLSCWTSGECELSPRCASDHESETAPGGTPRDCRPYLCGTNGTCKTSCTSPGDCAAPAVCDANQRCVPPPAETTGCGCRLGPRPQRRAWIFIAFLALAGWIRRRSVRSS
jgi:hypothetical protein